MRTNVSFVAPPLIITRDELHYGSDVAEKAPAEIDEMLAVQ